jgi:hypothetical protein
MSSNNFNICFFGCWNRGCLSDQKAVANNIIQNKNKFNCMIIAGDNYYKNKKNGEDLTIIDKGYECFKGFDKDVHIILGNHDVESDAIITKQWSTFKGNWNLYLTNHQVIHDNPSFIVNMLFINTNYYHYDLKMKYYKDVNLDDKIKIQNKWIEQKINETIIKNPTKQIQHIIVGHHPLFYKNKKVISRIIEYPQKDFLHFIKNIGDTLISSQRKLLYLCADEHLYQEFEIGNVKQIICGTGGAILDDMYVCGTISSNTSIVGSPNIPVKCIDTDASYGYCTISINEHMFESKYTPVIQKYKINYSKI